MSQFVDILFPVYGQSLYADHNYYLYSALCSKIQELHSLEEVFINTITGLPNNNGEIKLTDKSTLLIRTTIDNAKLFTKLKDSNLKIMRYQIRLGNPLYRMLEGKTELIARLVVIKNAVTPELFKIAADKQLDKLEIKADIEVLERLTIRIPRSERNYTVVGFKAKAFNLSKEDSIKLQVSGIGGKHKLGCGVFV